MAKKWENESPKIGCGGHEEVLCLLCNNLSTEGVQMSLQIHGGSLSLCFQEN
jgi:hypothetical protein